MSRTLLCCLFLVSASAAFAQDKQPEGAPEAEAGARAYLVLDTGGHASAPLQLRFTPDGKKLVSASLDKTVQIWNVDTGERLHVIRPPIGRGNQGVPHGLVLDGQGRQLAFSTFVAGDKNKPVQALFVYALDTAQGRYLAEGGDVLAFSPDGKILAVSRGTGVRLVDAATGKELVGTKNAAIATGAKRNVVALAFSPDGTSLAAVAEDDMVYLVDVTSHKLRQKLTLPGTADDSRLRDVAWVDGKTLLSGGGPCRQGRLQVWDLDKGELKKHYAAADLTQHLPDGRFKIAVTLLPLAGTTRVFVPTRVLDAAGYWVNSGGVFDWNSGELSKGFLNKDIPNSHHATVSADGTLAAQGHATKHEIVLWNTRDGKVVRRLHGTSSGAARNVFFNDSGTAVAWGRIADAKLGDRWATPVRRELDLTTLTSRALTAEDAKTYKAGLQHTSGPWSLKIVDSTRLEVEGPEPVVFKNEGTIMSATFVPGNKIALVNFTGSVHVLDPATKKNVHTTPVVSSEVRYLSQSRDGRYLLIGSPDQTVTVYDPTAGKVLLTLYPAGEDWIVWTPEGYYAATPGGERLMGWHVNDGPNKLAAFYPAERFRKQLYRPDVIKLVLEKGSVEEALKAANAALKKEGVKVPDGVADVAKLLPPTVELSVADQSKLPTVKFKVSSRAGAKEQPIKSLRLFVDGRPFTDTKAAAAFERGVLNDVQEWSVTLPPGKHQVAVLVRSADSSGISNELELDCRAAVDKPVMHVLAIGVDVYQDKALNLGCAVNDARLIADTFTRTCKGALYPEVNTQVLLNDMATRDGIRDAIRALRTNSKCKVKDNDLVVIFFAGHGAKEKEQFYLLTHEANVDDLAQTALSGMQLRDDLKDLPCQVLLMLDACHSGAFGAKGKLSAKNLKPATDAATRTFTDDEVGIAVMCAAMGNETAAERKNNGLFTAAVAEALTAQKDVPINRANHRQYILHLQSYVFDKVTEDSQDKQHPFLHLPWVVQSFPIRQLP